MAKAAAAQETLAYCTSCKMDLNHRIVAMKGDRIAKVECLTCKKEHAYKAAKGVTDPAKAAAKAAKAKAAKAKKAKGERQEGMTAEGNPIEAEWQKLMNDHREAPLKTYTMKGKFQLGDKIAHTSFGDGIVGKLIYPNKIEVIFQTDIKVLIYGGA